MAPFAGVQVFRETDETGGETVRVRAARVVVSETGAREFGLRFCHMEWLLSRPGVPEGTPLRPRRVVEMPSFAMGGDATLRGSARAADGGGGAGAGTSGAAAGEDAFGISAAEIGGGAPAVAGLPWGCAAAWKGCVPRAGVWRFGTEDLPDGFLDEPSGSAALERVVSGSDARCFSLLAAPETGHLFAATRREPLVPGGNARDTVRLFVTRAGEAREKPRDAVSECERFSAAETPGDSFPLRDARAPGLLERKSPSLLADESCPICLEVPGAGGDAHPYAHDSKTDPFAEAERLKNVVVAKCCGAPFCRSCLVAFFEAFPKEAGCPYCRDVVLFDATAVECAPRGERGETHRHRAAPWREISLDFARLPRAFRTTEAEAANPDAEVSGTGGGSDAAYADSDVPCATPREAGTVLDDGFSRPPIRRAVEDRPSTAASSLGSESLSRDPDPRGAATADGKPLFFGRAGLSEDFFRVDRYGADLPPAHISDAFLRGLASTDLVVSAAVGGPSSRSFAGRPPPDDGMAFGEGLGGPLGASFVGFAAGPGGVDDTLVRQDRETFAVSEPLGALAVLTERGVALLDAREETVRAAFEPERASA